VLLISDVVVVIVVRLLFIFNIITETRDTYMTKTYNFPLSNQSSTSFGK